MIIRIVVDINEYYGIWKLAFRYYNTRYEVYNYSTNRWYFIDKDIKFSEILKIMYKDIINPHKIIEEIELIKEEEEEFIPIESDWIDVKKFNFFEKILIKLFS